MSSIQELFPYFFPSPFKRDIKAIIGFWPKDLSLYKLALRHASAYPFRKKRGERNNERLEYLGDAVIDLVVAEALFYRFPKEDEGYLTKMRSKLVSRNNLNRVADELGLPNLLVANLKGNHSESVYGDALEALVGACYIDLGLQKTQYFVMNAIVEPFVSNEELMDTTHNYKSEVIEHFQGFKKSFRFEELERSGEQHNTTFTMGLYVGDDLVATGEGSSKKKGEEAASKAYYQKNKDQFNG
ncbi:MAG: ribonuclease III [Schleiferiaceae bacterium]|jgi:ribonuclease-3